MIDWNDTNLPNPAQITVSNISQNLRKKMESGRTVQRQRWSTPLEVGTVTFSFLKEQFQIFKGVWKHYLRNGNDPFLIDLPVGGNNVLTQCEVKFVSDFTYQYKSIGNVSVQANIEFAEVETIDELALRNLIDVGELTVAGELDTIVARFINDTSYPSSTTIKMTLRKSASTVPIAYQFWDGTIGLTTNSNIPNKTLPITPQEEIFTVNAWANVSNADPTPNESQILEQVTFFNSFLLYEFNPRANFPKHYWRYLDFVGCYNLIMPESNGSFIYPIKPSFQGLRITNMPNLQNLIFELEDDAQIEGLSETARGLDIGQNASLISFQTIPAPSLTKCRIKNVYFVNNDALLLIDLSEYVFYTEISTSIAPFIDLSGHAALTTVNINGCESTGDDAGRGYIYIDNNPSLTNINIGGDNPFQFKGSSDLRDNALTIQSLKAIVDKLRGDSTQAAGFNKIRISGNPCWQSNALFPARSRTDIVISSITSTATDFTVTTSVSHGLTAGDYTVIAGALVSDYDGLHTVASVTATTYTVTSAINAGSAGSGGTTSQEGEQDTAYVEERALANNFIWVAS